MDVRGGRVCWTLGEVALTVGRSSILAWGDAAAKARDGDDVICRNFLREVDIRLCLTGLI